jgi:hypothetical protein
LQALCAATFIVLPLEVRAVIVAFSEKPEIGIVRKHRTDSGLIRYDQRSDLDWPQVAREIIVD